MSTPDSEKKLPKQDAATSVENTSSVENPDTVEENTDSADAAAATADAADANTEDDDSDDTEAKPEDQAMSLRDHLRELRKRLLYCFLIIFIGFFACYHFAQTLFEILMAPMVAALPEGTKKLMYKAPAEAFLGYMKVAFVTSIFATSPLSFYQVWAFIAPGLHKEERIYLLPLAFFSAVCFLSGAAFCYYVAFPFIFEFLMSFNSPILESRPTVEDSLSFVLRLIVAFGCIFELPLFALFLSRLGIVTAAWMRKVRRYAILASFILAAILSPPEVMSMLLMAVPLLILYEFSIIVAAVFGKKQPPKKDEPSDDDDDEYEDDDDDEEEASVKPTASA